MTLPGRSPPKRRRKSARRKPPPVEYAGNTWVGEPRHVDVWPREEAKADEEAP